MNLLSYGKSCDIPIADPTCALKTEAVSYRYAGAARDALSEVSFEVRVGERVALMGPNGAGKSTLIKLVVGLVSEQKGTIEVHGNRVGNCHHRVALVPQRSDVDWNFPVTVREVVMMGRFVHLGWMRRPRSDDHAAVERALATMKIEDLSESHIGTLSGGQQQRVMLARALAHEADLVLLDEPLNNLDVATQELIFHVLEQLCSEDGKTAIVSTHDVGILKDHFSRALFLDQTVIAEGPIEETLTPQTIARAYGFEFHAEEDLSRWLNGSRSR